VRYSKMIIYFIGDTHFGKSYPFLRDYELNISKRNLDVIANSETIVNSAIEDKADLVIFLGDVYERKIISPTIRKIVREKIFIPLYEANIPVIIIGGNHDSARNPKRGVDIQELSNFPNVQVYTEFKADIKEYNGKKIGLLLLPFNHFDVLADLVRDSGITIPKGEHNYLIAQKSIQSYIKQICETTLKDCDTRILIGHYYLDGAKIRETNNPDMIYGEFKFTKQMVQKELFDLVIFGHVHLKQEMWNDNRIIIPGSIDRLDLGERDSDKFYVIYEVETDDLTFKNLESRKLFKIDIEIPHNTDDFTQYIVNLLPKSEQIHDALCKVSIRHPKGEGIKIDKNKIEAHFKECYYSEVFYSEAPSEDQPYLREVNLDPKSLFNDYLNQKYGEHEYYNELKRRGRDLLEKELSSIEVTAKGALSVQSINMQNFNNYGKGPNKIIFDQDSYVVKGPTGSGKSTILDAITFALFKKSTRRDVGLTLDEILYNNGFVELELYIGDNLLSLKRSQRSPKLQVKLNGEELYKGLSINEKEQKIEDIIGYDYEGFTSSFFIRQQELQVFSSLTSGERQDRLAKLFKLKIFQRVEDKLKTYIKTIEQQKENLEGQIIVHKQNIEQLLELEIRFKQHSIELEQLKKEQKVLSDTVEKTRKEIDKISPKALKYAQTQKLKEELQGTIEKDRNELESYKKLQVKVNNIQEQLKNYEDVPKEKENLMSQKGLVEKKQHEKELTQSEINNTEKLKSATQAQYESQLEDVSKQLEKKDKRLKGLKTEMTKDEAFTTLKNVGRKSERLERLQEIELPMAKEYSDENRIKEFKELEQLTKKELKELEPKQRLITKDIFISDELFADKKGLEQKYNEIDKDRQQKIAQYAEQIKEYNEKLSEKNLTDDFKSQLKHMENKIQKIKKFEEEKSQLEAQLKQQKDYITLIAKVEKDLLDMDNKLKGYDKELETLEPAYKEFSELSQIFGTKTDELNQKNVSIESTNKDIEHVQKEINKIKEIKEKIKGITKEINLVTEDIEISSMLQKNIFHLNGVPKFAIEKILPSIATRASEILSDLTEGRLNQIVFKTLESGKRVGFDIHVYDGENDREASSYSGGEKTQINAAIRFAIMEKIAEIPDTTGAIFRKSNTLIIDEGDLGTLDDETARQKFVEKILELKSMFKKIILITHLEDVAVQFPNLIRIGRDESGKSKIL